MLQITSTSTIEEYTVCVFIQDTNPEHGSSELMTFR